MMGLCFQLKGFFKTKKKAQAYARKKKKIFQTRVKIKVAKSCKGGYYLKTKWR